MALSQNLEFSNIDSAELDLLPSDLFNENEEFPTRTLDDILNERCQDIFAACLQNPQTRVYWLNMFTKLRKEILDKTPNGNDFQITEAHIADVEKRFNISELSTSIDTFKKNIVEAYLNLINTEQEYFTLRKTFDKFSENCTNLTEGLSTLSSDEPTTDDDKQLSELIFKKLEKSYSFLDLETIKTKYSDACVSFSLLKDVMMHVKNLDQKYVCPCCWENQVDCFFIPCGHTYCNACYNKAKQRESSICHMCREPILECKLLFFS